MLVAACGLAPHGVAWPTPKGALSPHRHLIPTGWAVVKVLGPPIPTRPCVLFPQTKKTLSANSEVPINVEMLMEEIDFASKVTRDKFEELSAPLLSSIKPVLQQVGWGSVGGGGAQSLRWDSVDRCCEARPN